MAWRPETSQADLPVPAAPGPLKFPGGRDPRRSKAVTFRQFRGDKPNTYHRRAGLPISRLPFGDEAGGVKNLLVNQFRELIKIAMRSLTPLEKKRLAEELEVQAIRLRGDQEEEETPV
jgi:hypothetical protein